MKITALLALIAISTACGQEISGPQEASDRVIDLTGRYEGGELEIQNPMECIGGPPSLVVGIKVRGEAPAVEVDMGPLLPFMLGESAGSTLYAHGIGPLKVGNQLDPDSLQEVPGGTSEATIFMDVGPDDALVEYEYRGSQLGIQFCRGVYVGVIKRQLDD